MNNEDIYHYLRNMMISSPPRMADEGLSGPDADKTGLEGKQLPELNHIFHHRGITRQHDL